MNRMLKLQKMSSQNKLNLALPSSILEEDTTNTTKAGIGTSQISKIPSLTTDDIVTSMISKSKNNIDNREMIDKQSTKSLPHMSSSLSQVHKKN
tara:strand:+ start:770 stop:1051 length:282 start_codon:yes stop_codon:yes gene_type:complete